MTEIGLSLLRVLAQWNDRAMEILKK